MNRKIRVGIIGTGVGLRTYLPSFRKTGRADVVAVAGSSRQRSQHFAGIHHIELACTDAAELCALRALDLICVTSPPEFHLEHAQLALASPVPVIIEKPAGLGYEESVQIERAAQSRHAWTLVNYQLRFMPAFQHTRRLIASGVLGEVYSLELTYRGGSLASPATGGSRSWQRDPDRGGGVKLSMGSHLLDLAMVLLNSTAHDLQGYQSAVHTRISSHSATSACPFFAASMRIDDATVWVSASEAAHSPRELSMEILGSAAALRYDTATKQLRVYKNDEIVSTEYATAHGTEDDRSLFRQAFDHAAEAMVAAIMADATEVPHAATPTDNLRVVRCLEQAITETQ